MRRTDACRNCGEIRELAAHGLCFACYRADERKAEAAARPIDRHSPAIRKEHKKMFKAVAALMGGLSDLGVGREHVMAIKKIVEPYLAPIQEYLNTVNGEHESKKFTVHQPPPGDKSLQ